MQFQTQTVENIIYLYCADAGHDCLTQQLQEYICHLTGETPVEKPFTVAVGPRAISPWSSNLVSILDEIFPNWKVTRIERYICYDDDPGQIDDLTHYKLDGAAATQTPPPKIAIPDTVITIADIGSYNERYCLNMDTDDVKFYESLFTKLGRNPTSAELHDLANCNSEHSRHHIFRGSYQVPVTTEYGPTIATLPHSMMDLVKKTLALCPNKSTSIVAFSDNSSAIRGQGPTIILLPATVGQPCEMRPVSVEQHTTFTAETHNFPTGIAPFQGATTGTGGRLRDTQAIGQGGLFVAGTCGYCVGQIDPVTLATDPTYYNRWSPVQILLQASDGASDYGNKVGEPVIQGFTRAFGGTIGSNRIEWLKPIMFSGGIGKVFAGQAHKCPVDGEFIIARVGGPTYRLGVGGGAASSGGSSSSSDKLLAAVQRGDAQMENRMDRWLRACITHAHHLGRPFICSIHDQGAGGMGNVTKEIVDGFGAIVSLEGVSLGDKSLTMAEIWTAESQEQNTVLLRSEDVAFAQTIAKRERVKLDVIGRTRDTGKIHVLSGEGKTIVDLPLSLIDPPRKTFILPAASWEDIPWIHQTGSLLDTLSTVDVGSKRFLTTKVDRSVGGLIVQQQCVGPLQTPVADVAVIADSFVGFTGAATAIGEQPLVALSKSVEGSVRMAICEMLTNLVWAPITALEDIRCSGNWMWPAQTPQGKGLLYRAVQAVSRDLITLGIAIDGGKDSVSMSAKVEKSGVKVDAPPSFVISGYIGCTDIRKVVTPGFKQVRSSVWYVPMPFEHIAASFKAIQELISQGGVILAGHDVSDGGLMTTLLEMCFASEGHFGFIGNSENDDQFDDSGRLSPRALERSSCSSSPAVVLETNQLFNLFEILPHAVHLGHVQADNVLSYFTIHNDEYVRQDLHIPVYRSAWESTATALEKLQTVPELAQQEHDFLVSSKYIPPKWSVPPNLHLITNTDGYPILTLNARPKACVMRGEGSNGDREMCAALWVAGFEVHDVTTSDLTDGRLRDLSAFQLLVFVGGFTYSDVLGAAVGWAAILRNCKALTEFIKREDTLVLGVCNGFQLLAEIGWIKGRLLQNKSKRFESRFVNVKVTAGGAHSPWFGNNLQGMIHGVWIAHGQGQYIGDDDHAICYVDGEGKPTEQYPLNPNGSAVGVAGVTSLGGRILGMMPHPERCFKSWQLPWSPPEIDWATTNYNTGWVAMFRNAYDWCIQRDKIGTE
jgi:phosphoribosylformylglycinamidine synthase